MSRFRLLASTIPLLLLALLARGESRSALRPCIAIGETVPRIGAAPWQADSYVSFTEDPGLATVRVQIVGSAELADFAVVDDLDSAEASACDGSAAHRSIAVSAAPSPTGPVIYLSRDPDADYRVFVQSRSFTVQDAAALIVGAHHGRGHLRAAL
ncbi:hypothetical protein [Tardiphaga sp.]|uniref:hypothetical protein n=1 Tax=Tardiphaga sp. TaxID=1926292 RepID=UPI0025D4C602|nr:hypothetical protein [Tardiphaga sp.]